MGDRYYQWCVGLQFGGVFADELDKHYHERQGYYCVILQWFDDEQSAKAYAYDTSLKGGIPIHDGYRKNSVDLVDEDRGEY